MINDHKDKIDFEKNKSIIEGEINYTDHKDPINFERKNFKNNVLFFGMACLLLSIMVVGFVITMIKSKTLNDNVQTIPIVKMIADFIRNDIYIEVPVEGPPDAPEVAIMSQYIKSRNSRLSIEMCYMISKIVSEKSDEYNIPSNLIIGIIEKESLFNPSVTTEIPAKKGFYAKGLMQVFQGENIEIDQDKIYNLAYNIDMGCQIFNKKLSLNNGNFEKALANYSGNAENYTESVLANTGRYSMFTWRIAYKNNSETISMK